ncbi:MAG: caspase family protein [Bacteroidales bacterium]|nr:caspase family protein [Bacteroidales bacterium]
MRIICLIMICALVNISDLVAQNKRALLIGIGDYPEQSGWSKIHGQNDLDIIRKTLLVQGFSEDYIVELRDSEAKFENINDAFQALLEAANKNDIVYIQFSGHGQRITDLNGDEKEDGLDEAWIPYDAMKSFVNGVYEGENHITDDFLNDYLTKLRFKVGYAGKIIVIADACHSGSGSRGLSDEEDVYKRGSSESFVIPCDKPNVIRKGKPVDWLFVVACKSYQTNYEYKAEDGNFYGSLSCSIAKNQGKLMEMKYSEAIDMWNRTMINITRYPQDIDNEGRPCKKNNNLF